MIDFHPTGTEKLFNVLLVLIEVKLIFHGIRHPRSDGLPGKADALQKVDCYFRDCSQNMFFMSYERQRRYSIIYDNECKNISDLSRENVPYGLPF